MTSGRRLRWGLCLAAALAAGCRTAAPPAPPPASPPAAEPTPLEIADRLFESGDLPGAAKAYEGVLSARPADGAGGGDRALYRLAMIALTPKGADPARGLRLLRRLIADYPASPYRASAELLLEYEAEARRLREQLEALKAIDLESPPGP